MSDRRVVHYLVFPNFYDAPFLVGLLREYRDVYCTRRLIVIDSTVSDFFRVLLGTPLVNSQYDTNDFTYHVRLPLT